MIYLRYLSSEMSLNFLISFNSNIRHTLRNFVQEDNVYGFCLFVSKYVEMNGRKND